MINNASTSLIYDATFEGFLSCVFAIYELKLGKVFLQRKYNVQSNFFSDEIEITNDFKKSERVWNSIKRKTQKDTPHIIFYSFLSEIDGIESNLVEYIRYILDNKSNVDKDYTNQHVLKIAQTAKMVGREKHRMEAFIRFRLTKDDIYFAVIEPDFNVLPLIVKHFKRRYADQKWVIYDLKRKFGVFFDMEKVEFINMEFDNGFDPIKTSELHFSPDELEFQKLWLNYFNSTNIKSRKNMKLHIRHVPKRYWKYLSEKQPS